MKIICTFEALVEALRTSTEGVPAAVISEAMDFRMEMDEKLFKHHLVRWEETSSGDVLKPKAEFFTQDW